MRNNCGSYKTPEGGFVKYGVGNPGGSDLIGLRSLVVTPQMVGQRIGQFVAVEAQMRQGQNLRAGATLPDLETAAPPLHAPADCRAFPWPGPVAEACRGPQKRRRARQPRVQPAFGNRV